MLLPLRWRRRLTISMTSLLFGLLGIGSLLYVYINKQLPDITALRSVPLPSPLKIYSREGELIAAWGPCEQPLVRLAEVPPLLIKAFLATEDRHFWIHRGVDGQALLRAALELILTGQKSQGGSTITMQVARNFYLTRQKTFLRKLTEIALAFKIERTFSKQQILELYFNKIFMGHRAYGIAAAAQLYFRKNLNQLNLAEMALLAGMPKSPAWINPITNPNAAQQRRDFVLHRMRVLSFISEVAYQQARRMPIQVVALESAATLSAPYVAEMAWEVVRQRWGERGDAQGYQVYTTLDAEAQRAADWSLQQALLAYDKRHDYRGPEKQLGVPTPETLAPLLNRLKQIPEVNGLQPALVLAQDKQILTAVLTNGTQITLPSVWGSTSDDAQISTDLSQVIKPGAVIRVQTEGEGWQLAQLPQIQAALVALDPKTGAIKALSGGFSYALSKFNRVTQALRQPGSVLKPFIYAAALSKGYTLADVFNDAPLVFDSHSQSEWWRPQNVDQAFKGLTRLRIALIYSINLVTVRLLQAIGIPYALQQIEKFGFDTKRWPHNLTLALGSGELTPLALARGYAVLANGGYRINPYLIDHIVDSQGQVIYRAQPKVAPQESPAQDLEKYSVSSRSVPKFAARVLSKEVAFLVTSVLQDAIHYGAGEAIQALGRLDLAGKTGTTNATVDSWFAGFNGDWVCSVWMGFDQPRPLHEYAYQAALPLWLAFIRIVLQDTPAHSLPQPPTIRRLAIDPITGKRVSKGTPGAVDEYFKEKSSTSPLAIHPAERVPIEPLF